jgi:isopenicillin N synthase-like dioxygenase
VAEFDRIPVIDLAPLNNPEGVGVDRLCDDILTAYGTVGFGYLINHGIDPALIEGVFDASARFHAMPRAAKMQVELNELHRGFISINTSTDRNSKLARVTKPNQSESFMIRTTPISVPEPIWPGRISGPRGWRAFARR